MSEVANAGKHHRDSQSIGSGDHLVVTRRAAGLGDRCRTRLHGRLETVWKWEERITRQRGTRQV
jgi:hypothetical protein